MGVKERKAPPRSGVQETLPGSGVAEDEDPTTNYETQENDNEIIDDHGMIEDLVTNYPNVESSRTIGATKGASVTEIKKE